jgi:hypothetical protein
VAPNQQENTHFSMEREMNETYELDTASFVHKRIISALKRVEFFSDRISYMILRGRWCHIIALTIQATRIYTGKTF